MRKRYPIGIQNFDKLCLVAYQSDGRTALKLALTLALPGIIFWNGK